MVSWTGKEIAPSVHEKIIRCLKVLPMSRLVSTRLLRWAYVKTNFLVLLIRSVMGLVWVNIWTRSMLCNHGNPILMYLICLYKQRDPQTYLTAWFADLGCHWGGCAESGRGRINFKKVSITCRSRWDTFCCLGRTSASATKGPERKIIILVEYVHRLVV